MTRDAPKFLLAEFDGADALLAAAQAARAAGLRQLRAYAPFDIPGLAQVLGLRPRGISGACFAGTVLGGAGGFFMQWWAVNVSYPVDIGGRPGMSWPMFVPVSFSLAVLVGAFFALAAMLWRAGLPRLFHPVSQVPGFERASRDRFFLLLCAHEAGLTAGGLDALLQQLAPRSVSWVPDERQAEAAP